MKYYVYIDRLKTTNEVIYIGKGNDKRIQSFERNAKYNRKFLKYGINREIFLETENEKFALNEEIRLIEYHHTYYKDPLATKDACNFRKGGDGGLEEHWTLNRKNKISIQVKKALSLIDPIIRAQQKIRQKEGMKGHIVSESTKEKIRRSNQGKIISEESRRKNSESHKGKPNPNRGKKFSEKARKNMSIAGFARQKHSQKTRNKIGQAVKQRHQNPNIRFVYQTIGNSCRKFTFTESTNIANLARNKTCKELREIAKQFNCSYTTIRRIRDGVYKPKSHMIENVSLSRPGR